MGRSFLSLKCVCCIVYSSSYMYLLFLPVRFQNRISFTPDSDEINQPRVIVDDTKGTIQL